MASPRNAGRAWVAFLRGMNLGRRRITNDELVAAFGRLGVGEATAFLASGNVIFRAAAMRPEALREQIELGLARELGYEVPTFLRSDREVRAVARRAPFPTRELERRGKPQVLLLSTAASASARRLVDSLASDEDLLVLDERELYWLPRAGILDTALDLAAIERALGPTTMRTLRTIERLAAKLPD